MTHFLNIKGLSDVESVLPLQLDIGRSRGTLNMEGERESGWRSVKLEEIDVENRVKTTEGRRKRETIGISTYAL